MSFNGKSPTIKRIRYTPQDADPVNPTEGDVYFSDGTPRAEGLYVYRNGAWVAAGGGDIATEMLEFKPYITCRLASTANLDTFTELEAGDTIDGVVLVAGDLVLVKNQSTSSQNGVYVVPSSGPAARYSGADTFTELSYASACILEGTVNGLSVWFQNNLLTDLSDTQSWAASPATRLFTVPADKDVLWIQMAGGGGAGGSGGRLSGTNAFGGGGGGGAGVNPIEFVMPVTPGEVISVVLGKGGIPSPVQNTDFVLGGDGGFTSVTGLAGHYIIGGGAGGMGGETSPDGSEPSGGSATGTWSVITPNVSGGSGGRASYDNGSSLLPSLPGNSASESSRASGGTPGAAAGGSLGRGGGGGGVGGAGLEPGGDGGKGGFLIASSNSVAGANGGRSAGGGGGGGGWRTSAGTGDAIGKVGGFGGNGFVRITY